ncbi:hypothetical protein GCM10027614_12630 [Micromonospora vulcania]
MPVRADAGPDARPLPSAAAGVNAHINFDLPFALVTTFDHLESEPVDGSDQHHDYLEINNIFADKIPGLRRGYLERWQLLIDMLNGDIDDWYQGNWSSTPAMSPGATRRRSGGAGTIRTPASVSARGWTTTPLRSAGCCSRPWGRSCSSRDGGPRASPRGAVERGDASRPPAPSVPCGPPEIRAGPGRRSARGRRPDATVGRPGGAGRRWGSWRAGTAGASAPFSGDRGVAGRVPGTPAP